jgi:hypothetical protein
MQKLQSILIFVLFFQSSALTSMKLASSVQRQFFCKKASEHFAPDPKEDIMVLDRWIRPAKNIVQPVDDREQAVSSGRWVPAMPGQADLIQAINAGDIQEFYRCMNTSVDYASSNAQGYNPLNYVTKKLLRTEGLQRTDNKKNQHKEMFKFLTILQIKSDYGV